MAATSPNLVNRVRERLKMDSVMKKVEMYYYRLTPISSYSKVTLDR